MPNNIVGLSGAEQAALIESRKLSPVDLVKAYLSRIEKWDDVLHAWISVDSDRALAAARVAEQEIVAGNYRGPLHGIPYGVKDQMHAMGFPTTLGTKVLEASEMAPPYDAAVIERLNAAGAILLGKQNLHEFGRGGTIDFPYGQPRNPWNPEYSASSSSTGSGIAPAAQMCTFSLGEDTGGSIRGPAAQNGIVGLRPTYGRVSRFGGVMDGYTCDTIGPLARTVGDVALVLGTIAGYDSRDPLSSKRSVDAYTAYFGKSVAGMRLAFVREISLTMTEEVRTVFESALGILRDLGAVVEEISIPMIVHAVPLQLLTTDVDVAASFVKKYLRDRYDRFDVGSRTRLAAASLIPATIYNRAMRARVLVRRQVLEALRLYDAIIAPTVPSRTKKIEQAQEKVESMEDAVQRLVERRLAIYPFSMANVPTLSVPMGVSLNGLPLGIQFAGKPFDEKTVFQIGHNYERAAGWYKALPDLNNTVVNKEKWRNV